MGVPRVSVVMPIRNASATLVAALDSLRSQDHPDFEIVAVDHRSSDDTGTILRRTARLDSRIRLLHCDGSFVDAANLAWRSAKGEFIARMDSDDVASPRRLALQADLLSRRPDLAGCATLVRILKRGPDGTALPPDKGYRLYETWINSVVSPDEIAAQRFVDSPLPNPATMVRRSVLEQAGGYRDPSWAEDYDLWLRLLHQGHRFGKVAECLLDWYDAPTRSTRTVARYAADEFQRAKCHYLSQLEPVAQKGVVLCGAGPVGKQASRFLLENGVKVHAFLEVNPRQVGNRIAGIPVEASGALPSFSGRAVALGAVGQRGARERVRGLARESGFREGDDFFSIA